ncbi:LLM class flavin-dependent oxidoreductase [Gulosibacter molinativorax]|nr:LLM class flavin-dependent oxidoreductase [Gulosibacter molinativorax]
MMPALSVLDLIPLRTDQSSPDTITASRRLAAVADELGYRRYWVAEHHLEPFASTSPALFMGIIAAATTQISVGSGAVLLPNHAPYEVAEQFAMLEAAFPGRVDLGLGRAPGGHPVAIHMLRGGRGDDGAAVRFPQDAHTLALMLRPEGVDVQAGEQTITLTATPKPVTSPRMWVLGTSPSSARTAAELGARYVYGHHFFGAGTAEALDIYRSEFRPSEFLDKPEVFLTMNVVVGDTDEEAHRLALPSKHTMLSLATGGTLIPQPLVEEAELRPITDEQQPFIDQQFKHWVIGTPDYARAQLEAFAKEHEVDEIMINPGAGTFAGAEPGRSPAREQTLRLLAGK